MPRFRLFLAWLLMASLPLQGMAAASMLFCGSATAARVAQASGGQPSHHSPAAGATAPDHASGAPHDHSTHGHAAADTAEPTHAGADAGSPGVQKAPKTQNGHSCPICASCCQVVAVGGFVAFPQDSAAPSVLPSHPLVRVVSRATPLPDKPPRA